jgi:hypothetical protein
MDNNSKFLKKNTSVFSKQIILFVFPLDNILEQIHEPAPW